jgi:hypothetical protein
MGESTASGTAGQLLRLSYFRGRPNVSAKNHLFICFWSSGKTIHLPSPELSADQCRWLPSWMRRCFTESASRQAFTRKPMADFSATLEQ